MGILSGAVRSDQMIDDRLHPGAIVAFDMENGLVGEPDRYGRFFGQSPEKIGSLPLTRERKQHAGEDYTVDEFGTYKVVQDSFL